MASLFIFAEQVRRVVKSGKKEIEVAAGARISSAAADLIKEHQIRIKTVAPGTLPDEPTLRATATSAASAAKKDLNPPAPTPVTKAKTSAAIEAPVEISNSEIEDIVNRVLKRFEQLKGSQTIPATSTDGGQVAKEDEALNDDDLIICRCEEITRGEIKEAIRSGIRTLNGIKRITRAGMGLCQGQTCQQLVARILAEELGISPAEIDPTTARGPVRPLRLEVFANS
jgi:bacterioferritin-associated ferredoxin